MPICPFGRRDRKRLLVVEGNRPHRFLRNAGSYPAAGSPSVGQAELFWGLGRLEFPSALAPVEGVWGEHERRIWIAKQILQAGLCLSYILLEKLLSREPCQVRDLLPSFRPLATSTLKQDWGQLRASPAHRGRELCCGDPVGKQLACAPSPWDLGGQP